MSSAAGNETNKTAENSSLQVQPTIAPTLSPIPVEGQVFAGFVVFTGFLSMLANGLVMSILIVVNRQKRKSTNVLIVNQMAIDLFTCGCITITYAVRLQNYYFVGLWGDIMCKLVDNEYFIWIGLNASVASLCIITFERYLKVVHSLFHRKYFRKWMIPVAVAFGWGIGFFTNTPVAWLTSSVVDGVCYGSVFFPSADSMAAYGIYYFIFTFFGPLVLFVYCYGHIVFIIRKQLKIHPLQDPAGDQPEPVNNIVRKNTARSQVTHSVINPQPTSPLKTRQSHH